MASLFVYLLAGVVILSLVTLLWLLSLYLGDASIIDIFWGTGYVILNGLYFFLTPQGMLERKILISLLVTLWGLRLSIFLLYRNWRLPEDYRYRNWRQQAGTSWWWRSYFKVFLLQGVLIWILSLPFLIAQGSPVPDRLTVLDYAGLMVWGVGFAFETVGDLQLARFRARPENRGKLLTKGLWRYTRHPNYFGDAVQWWGFFLIAASAGGAWTLYSPLLMTTLLLRVSGVRMLERGLKESKPGYEAYQKSTSAFLPWFPRDEGSG